MSFSETISPFLGRCAFVWFYLTGALNILGNWHQVAEQLVAKHVPVAPLVLLVALLLISWAASRCCSAITPAMAR